MELELPKIREKAKSDSLSDPEKKSIESLAAIIENMRNLSIKIQI